MAFGGKGKRNEAAGREELCHQVCVDKLTPSIYIDPWNPSHQMCACWDSEEYVRPLIHPKIFKCF